MKHETKPVLDPCCGTKMFYFNKDDSRVAFGDIRNEDTNEFSPGRKLIIRPDLVMDFRALPYPDENFHAVIFDPPHLMRAGDKSWLAQIR